jgi:hypothetical protein
MTPQGCAGGAVGCGRQRCAQAAPAEDARSGAGVLRAQQAACNGQHPRAVGWLHTTCDVCNARSGVRGVGAPTRCVVGSMECTVERVLRGTRDTTAVPNVQHAPSDITRACPGFHAPAPCAATPRAPRCRHAFGTTVGAMRHAPCDGRGAIANLARAPRWRLLLVRAGDGPPLHSNCSGLSRLLCHRGAVPKAESRTRAGEPPDVARPARHSARRIRVASRSVAVVVGRCGIRSHEPLFIHYWHWCHPARVLQAVGGRTGSARERGRSRSLEHLTLLGEWIPCGAASSERAAYPVEKPVQSSGSQEACNWDSHS